MTFFTTDTRDDGYLHISFSLAYCWDICNYVSTEVHLYHSRMRGYMFLSFYFFFSLSMSIVFFYIYIYVSHSSQEKTKQKKEMNTSHLAHISISIFCRCRSLLFSVDAASYFLVGRHRLSFFYARDRKFRKKNIKKRETTHFFPYACLRLVS
jgi:hypothetical protein